MEYREYLFKKGEYYPHVDHEDRIARYKDHEDIFKSNQWDVFEKYSDRISATRKESLYVSSNLASVIAKKNADFLFGEMVQISAGNGENTPEQIRFDNFIKENHLNIVFYENALTNSFKGDGYLKVRYGQEFGGTLDKSIDPYRIFIENQPAEFVFPEPSPHDKNKIIAYHIAYPVRVSIEKDEWYLQVESHYAGRIEYSQHYLVPFMFRNQTDIDQFKIHGEIEGSRKTVYTGIPLPLVVHIPNFSLDNSWEGEDEFKGILPLLRELAARLTGISRVLTSHSDPILALPSGSLELDENGIPQFHPSLHKVIEIMDKNEAKPEFITWNGNLQESFQFIEQLTKQILTIAELPEVALGSGDMGTSGSSALAIRYRLNSILSKTNRKRQYYQRGITQTLLIAQLLEHSVNPDADYEITTPKLTFKDGLPKDRTEEANRISMLVMQGLMSKKAALMYLYEMNEQQAEKELEAISNEQDTFADASIFNSPSLDDEKFDIEEEQESLNE